MAESGLGQEKNLGEAADFYKQAALGKLREGYIDAGRVKWKLAHMPNREMLISGITWQ